MVHKIFYTYHKIDRLSHSLCMYLLGRSVTLCLGTIYKLKLIMCPSNSAPKSLLTRNENLSTRAHVYEWSEQHSS